MNIVPFLVRLIINKFYVKAKFSQDNNLHKNLYICEMQQEDDKGSAKSKM